MTITNGTVEFERVVRPAEFESKRAKSSLFFVVEDGQDAAKLQAEAMLHAQSVVLAALGLPAASPVGTVEASLQRGSAEATPQGRTRAATKAATAATSTPPVPPPPAPDPYEAPAQVTPPAAEDPWGASSVPAHTDAELSDDGLRKALEAKVSSVEKKDQEALTVKMRELIGELNGGDPKKSVFMLSKEQRSVLLDRLMAL